MKTETTRNLEDASETASQKFRELLALGWRGTGTEGHEKSRALGLVWPVAVLTMFPPGSRKKHIFRFVGKPDTRTFLYS